MLSPLLGEELSYFLTTTSIQHPWHYPAGGLRRCAPSPAATRALCLQELGNKDGPTHATQ